MDRGRPTRLRPGILPDRESNREHSLPPGETPAVHKMQEARRCRRAFAELLSERDQNWTRAASWKRRGA